MRRIWILALACVTAAGGALAAGAGSRPTATPQGRTWDSIKHLPDWTGVWVLSDESWTEAVKASTGQDEGATPLTPRYLAIRDEQNQSENENRATAVPENEYTCTPVGIPESTAIPIGHEYLLTPGRVTVIFENGIVRRIDTSGRPHPPEKDLVYSFGGHSIGHWEGRTLVVDTIGLIPQAEFLIGLRVTDKTHLTERITRQDRDTLVIDTVVTDPEIFTRPWVYSRSYKHYASAPGEYYPCNGSNRDVIVDGKQTGVDLTPPPAQKP